MSEESPHSSNHSHQKSWIGKLSQLLTGEPQDQEDLLEILKEAREKHLLGSDAFAMIEGVMRVSQMRARDIMVPRIQMVVVPQDAELKTILPLVLEHGHSRFPELRIAFYCRHIVGKRSVAACNHQSGYQGRRTDAAGQRGS